MFKRIKNLSILVLTTGVCCVLFSSLTFAYWEWTPGRGRWINPKYYVGETSSEQWEIAMESYNSENYETAIREFKKLLEHFPTSKEAPEAQFMIGDSYEKLGALYEACLSYQKVVDEYPSTSRLKEIAERQKKIADYFYTLKSDSSLKDKARELFTMSKCEKAAEIYRMVIKNYPYYENADEAQYRIGDCYMKMKKYEIARTEFDKVISQYPDSSLVDDAEYQKGMCWFNESTRFPNSEQLFERAIKTLEEFIIRYPGSEFAEAAKENLKELNNRKGEKIYNIAKFYEKSGDIDAAKIYYKQVIEKFPDSTWATASKSRINNILKDENEN